MISFSNIGYNGRFGNQMFQYAALVGFAKASNVGWYIPKENSKDRKRTGSLGYDEMFELPHCFDLKYDHIDQPPKQRFFENGDMCRLPPNTDINGYFQNEKYFLHAKEEILSQFTFKTEIQEKSVSLIPNAQEFVSLHVRRGDYVQLQQYHPLITIEWYEAAMAQFHNRSFLIFSDDIPWCKQTFGSTHTYCHSGSSFVDMCTMSRCFGHITANSSFSWWGAYLGSGKVVVPKKWFGQAISHKNDEMIHPNGWVIL